ncbi:restriction endonuclease subunit S [Lacticaseibacillus nasuensis]|uniref:restriction endonuclease subunit S n=1 Tax=Lacticaseibacillus nasuensis TaxID=944671 RepID=UPI0006D0984F|nr:restriction endonuclease subunit S [Lacticaseibacillus nasuensis]
MNKKNVSTKRVPSIRVVGFTDEWEQRKLGDITKYKNGTAHEENVQSQGPFELITLKSVSEEGTIQSSGKFLASTDEALDAGSLVMVLSEQTPGAVGMTALVPLNHRYVLNQRVAQLSVDKKNVNPAFLSKAINRNQHYFELRSGGTKVQNISKSSVLDYKFYMPPREEQDKLAIFLLCIEETIALHQQKSEALKKVYRWAKRNLLPMPKESSPQIHIKNNNENWTTRKLGNILKPNTEKKSRP